MGCLKNRALQMLAGHGLPVFPTVSHLKHPQFSLKPYLDGKLNEVPSLWDEHAESTTGAFLRCDSLPENYVILDCDFSEESYYEELERLTGLALDELTTVRTTSGGRHLYLQCPNPVQLPGKLRFTFSDGVEKGIDVRCSAFGNGIMLPGSRATNNKGKIGVYEALGEGSEDAIFNLQWSMISEKEQEVLEKVVGRRKGMRNGRESGGASKAVVRLLEPVLSQLREDFDTNIVCTNLGNQFGAMIRTQAPAEDLANEAWNALIEACTEHMASQLEGHPRHKKSFVTNAIKSAKITQERLRSMLAEARTPAVAEIEGATEKLVYEFFGGAVGVNLSAEGDGTFALLRGVGYVQLNEQDWDNPETVCVSRESMFSGSGGLTWLESLLVALGLQGKEIPSGFDKALKDVLFRTSRSDDSQHQEEMRHIHKAYNAFSDHGWKRKLDKLDPSRKGRWLWNMAPKDGRGRRLIPFIALVEKELVVAVPPACKLTEETLRALGEPVGSYSARGDKKIHYYAVPEGMLDGTYDESV